MSARILPVQQMDKVIRQREGEKSDPKALGPNEMRLYSYYKPSLTEGMYEITATQTIQASFNNAVQQLDIQNTTVPDKSFVDAPQEFQVVVPRFSLDPDLINSYYPPDGHQDEGRVLPHIVLNDPHYPWEILAGTASNMNTKLDWDSDKELYRNLVPWVALVVFDPDDLRFTDEDEMLKLTKQADLSKQDAKGIFKMSINDYLSIEDGSFINYKKACSTNADYDKLKETFGDVDVIFPTKQMFTNIFGYDNTALEAHKYLAHVRHINTLGCPDAGVEEEGLFSIVISSRLGQFNKDQPQTQICHLVSIENVDATFGDWMKLGSDHIGMVSLFSWIYTALPPNPVNFVATVKNLVTNQQMLRMNDIVIKDIDDKSAKDGSDQAKASSAVIDRLRNGYTISRWRTQSGEETAAFNRGALVPGQINYPIAQDIPDCSNTSQDYQILDSQTGLMDLTYSSAWQLGKILAISDLTFSAALMRFRSAIHSSSTHQTQMIVSQMDPMGKTVDKLQTLASKLQAMSTGTTGDPRRFVPANIRAAVPDLQDPKLRELLRATMKQGVWDNATAGQAADGTGKEIYNEFNLDKGNNTDWAIIHTWICEKLCLAGIPPQYLLPESSYLQPESLRFFHIDDFWLDCFIDGALAVANHLDADDDTTRRQMKDTFNIYLKTPVERAGYKPQIPGYGFLIRSQLIKAMPDLRITVEWKPIKDAQGNIVQDNRASVCRWTKWDDETLMCLLDRQAEELSKITLAQPPHQQRFSLGSYVGGSGSTGIVEFQLRKLFTKLSPNTPAEWPPKYMGDLTQDVLNHWLNFDTRVLRVNDMALQINKGLQFVDTDRGEAYTDTYANSCELGLELNDPSYYFTIVPPSTDDTFQPTLDTQRMRQLYIRSADALSVDAARKKYLDDLKKSQPPAPKIAKKAPTTTPSPPADPSSSSSENPIPNPIATPPRVTFGQQPVLLSRLSASFSKTNGALTTTSKLQLTGIYADYNPPPKRFADNRYDVDDLIPTRNNYLFDLVFSIRKPINSDYNLVRVDIDIPTARPVAQQPKKDPSKPFVQDRNAREPLLEANYYGPGVRMLSNQRFTPFLFFNETRDKTTGNGNMHIELVPRSATDGYVLKLNDNKTDQLSFRLAEAPIAQLEVLSNEAIDTNGKTAQMSVGKAEVTMTEWYSTIAYPLGEPVSTKYQVIKRQVTRD